MRLQLILPGQEPNAITIPGRRGGLGVRGRKRRRVGRAEQHK